MTSLEHLTEWYLKQSNGEWEHSYGVVIETMDNPGWALHIDLSETSAENYQFSNIKCHRSKIDWFECSVEDAKFHGYGGVRNLEEIISIFINWAKEPNQ